MPPPYTIMKIAVYTGCSRGYWELMQLTAPNRSEYCKKYGYQLLLQEYPCDHALHMTLERVGQTLELVKQYDYLLFMGTDTCFTNMGISLESLINKYQPFDVLISKDVNGINNDVVIYRNCPAVWEWLANIFVNLFHIPNDQEGMKLLYEYGNGLNIKEIPQKEINAMPYWEYPYISDNGGTWTQGDFILHTPGLPLEKRIELIKDALKQVVR